MWCDWSICYRAMSHVQPSSTETVVTPNNAIIMHMRLIHKAKCVAFLQHRQLWRFIFLTVQDRDIQSARQILLVKIAFQKCIVCGGSPQNQKAIKYNEFFKYFSNAVNFEANYFLKGSRQTCCSDIFSNVYLWSFITCKQCQIRAYYLQGKCCALKDLSKHVWHGA